MIRPNKNEYYLEIARDVAKRSTCLKTCYGAVIVKNDEIISTGYNGAPRGRMNCVECGYCVRKELDIASGCRYEICRSIHAEANAIISASRSEMIGSTLYLSGFEYSTGELPNNIDCCAMCKRMIINAGISHVIFDGDNIKIIDVNAWILLDDIIPKKDTAKLYKEKIFIKKSFNGKDITIPSLSLIRKIPSIYNSLPNKIKQNIPDYGISKLNKLILILGSISKDPYMIAHSIIDLQNNNTSNLLLFLIDSYDKFIDILYDRCSIEEIQKVLQEIGIF